MFAEYSFTREATVQKYLQLYVATSHYIHLMQVQFSSIKFSFFI